MAEKAASVSTQVFSDKYIEIQKAGGTKADLMAATGIKNEKTCEIKISKLRTDFKKEFGVECPRLKDDARKSSKEKVGQIANKKLFEAFAAQVKKEEPAPSNDEKTITTNSSELSKLIHDEIERALKDSKSVAQAK